MTKRRRALGIAMGSVLVGLLVVSAPALARTRVVRPGKSIQAAINAAHPGDTILVRPGVYRQNLLIKKNRLTLRGQRAVLARPAHPAATRCPVEEGTPGICVLGQGNPMTGAITKRVTGVRITHLTVRGHTGDGIFAFGAGRFRVDHDRLLRNGGYGVFSLASKTVRYLDDLAQGNGDAGFYVGESPGVHALVERNRSLNNRAEGILLRSSTGGRVVGNRLSGNCAGMFVVAIPGPATGFTLSRNTVTRNNRACPGEENGPPPRSGIGIALFGAGNTTVSRNTVTRNRPSGPSLFSGGIVVIRGPGGTAPSGDVISRNVVRRNRPKDLFWDGSGTVRFSRNTCGSSQPTRLCR
jgi:parallel beta-helix repeat protein